MSVLNLIPTSAGLLTRTNKTVNPNDATDTIVTSLSV